MTLDDIIQYENEGTFVDFKAKQYHKERQEDLIKDIVAMANANFDGSRYIIIGVDLSNGQRSFVGVGEQLVDSAIYQKLLADKVEPEINLQYYPYDFNGIQMGIFEISGCEDQPYVLKNDYKTLRRGDIYIRKGSTQLPISKADLDRMFNAKMEKTSFKEEIDIFFENTRSTEIDYQALRIAEIRFPSKIATAVLRKAIEAKKNLDPHAPRYTRLDMPGLQYGHETIEYLEDKIAAASEFYRDHDMYFSLEELSLKLNFEIINHGSTYIEDATVRIRIDDQQGFMIPNEVLKDPSASAITGKVSQVYPDYPRVEVKDNLYVITEEVGNIKHNLPTQVFAVDLRLSAFDEMIGKKIELNFEVTGKNLKKPILKKLYINVV